MPEFIAWLAVSLVVISALCWPSWRFLSAWRVCRLCGRRLGLWRRLRSDSGYCGQFCHDEDWKNIQRLAAQRLRESTPVFQREYSPLPFTGARSVLRDRAVHYRAILRFVDDDRGLLGPAPQCAYCDGPLPLLERLTGGRFCSATCEVWDDILASEARIAAAMALTVPAIVHRKPSVHFEELAAMAMRLNPIDENPELFRGDGAPGSPSELQPHWFAAAGSYERA